ncbi:MAG: ATP-binding region ATPase domain protein [Gemmatimonadetes bacterium]|nr:ATP-binding region ATPase domain protein [Gemmatimonadota bacterium]
MFSGAVVTIIRPGNSADSLQGNLSMRRRMSLETKLPLLMSGIFFVVFAASLYATSTSLSRAATDTQTSALVRATQQLARLGETGLASMKPRYKAVADDPVVRRTLASASASPQGYSPVHGDTTVPGSVGAVLARLRTPTDSGMPVELWTADRRLAAYVGDDKFTIPAPRAENSIGVRPEVPFDGMENIGAVDSLKIGRLFLAEGRVSFWNVLPIVDHGKLVGYIAKEGRIAVNPNTDRSIRALAGEAVSMYYRNDDGSVWTTISGHVTDAPARRGASIRRPGVGRLLSNEERIPGTPLVIAMEVPESQVLAGPRAIVRSLALLSLLFLAAGTLSTWLIARRVARPLRGITIAAEAVARGDYDTRVPSVGEDETIRLAEAFNHMASEIEEGHSALEQQTIEAQAANRAKSDFLATMSHELRTPLNAIGGYVGLIEMGLRGPVSDEQKRDLQRVRAAQQHLLGLISGMLDLGRIETGRVNYDLTTILLDEFLGSLDALIAPQALAKSIALVYKPTDSTLAVLADSEKLRQVLLNLLSNAIRYTPSGGTITLGAEASGPGSVAIHVRDTGPGIPRDKQEQIFEPFVQLDRTLAHPNEGVGLGLAISRDLARGMGGELTVNSEVAEGARFTIILPRSSVSGSFQRVEASA